MNPNTCPKCGGILVERDSCDCDLVLAETVNRVAGEDRTGQFSTKGKSLLESRFAIYCTLFGVTGALGLPLLWWSPVFRTRAKIWLSIVVTIYTAALIAIAYYCVVFAWREIREFF